MCLQPCCHGTWLALGNSGYLYDLNIKTGALSRPRFTGITNDPSLQGAIGPLSYHKATKKLYTHGQALTEGSKSYFYEINRTSGAATRIGQLKTAAHFTGVPANDTEQGISAHFQVFSPDGNTLYAGGDSGTSHLNISLMTINKATGAATPYAANYDNSAVTAPCSIINGAGFHPISGLLYGWRQSASGVSSGFWISVIDTTTGIASTGRSLDRTSTGQVPIDMEMVKQTDGTVKAYAVGTSLFVCPNIDATSPVLTKIAEFTGTHGSETIVGLAKV